MTPFTPAVLDVARFRADGKNRAALMPARDWLGGTVRRFPLVRHKIRNGVGKTTPTRMLLGWSSRTTVR